MDSHAVGETTPALLDETIGACLTRTVAQHPDHEAVVEVSSGRRWTWAELDADVRRLAKALLAGGTARGDRVGIWAPNCAEWTIVQLATARIGAVLVTINPAYRTHELAFVLNQAGISHLFLAESFKTSDYVAMLDEVREQCTALTASTVLGGDAWDALLAGGDAVDDADLADREQALDPDDPINIQYTSGTTASPRAPPSATATSSTTGGSSARCAATPTRTASASRCRSTTASAWSWATSRPSPTAPPWSSPRRDSTPP